MQTETKTTFVQKRKAYLVMGGIGLVLAAGYLGLSLRLPFGQMDQPGAGVFPVAVGVILILASLATLWEGWQLDKAVRLDLPVGADRKRLLSLIGMLVGYFLALPWLGQMISSALFCMLLMRLLSDLSWLRIAAYSLAMSLMLYFVFVSLFEVPMPVGELVYYFL
jgi:putative tricarboxylic transport membrane protein